MSQENTRGFISAKISDILHPRIQKITHYLLKQLMQDSLLNCTFFMTENSSSTFFVKYLEYFWAS